MNKINKQGHLKAHSEMEMRGFRTRTRREQEGKKKNTAGLRCTSGVFAPSRCNCAFGLMYKQSGISADQMVIKGRETGK